MARVRAEAEHDGDRVQSVLTAFQLLEHMTAAGGELGLSQLATESGVPTATIHRMLQTLAQFGYVRQEPATRQYTLGPELIHLGGSAGRLLGSWARPALDRLVRETGETASLAVLDGAEIVYLAQVPSPHTLRMLTELGRRVPAHCTAAGKALLSLLSDMEVASLFDRHPPEPMTARTLADPAAVLAHLASVRAQGFAVEDGEQEIGVRAFAVAVDLDRPMAVTVSGPESRMSLVDVTRHIPLMRSVAAELAAGPGRAG
ncbi:IclR family transcriptional regulator [Amycolatopsis jejuensis]|uniref:IclR family transcriptional regulator n=1 Tax=Amycolatopsis jejuensis TaxID=330084 RepID=UPI00052732F0|nr:IclR family transcriptional regulator [Amycolatopsis jejuensis]